jgi:uncharacterized protein YkwD
MKIPTHIYNINKIFILGLVLVFLLPPSIAMGQDSSTTQMTNFTSSITDGGENTDRYGFSPLDLEHLVYSSCLGTTVPVSNEGYEQRVVELVNSIRTERSLSPLKRLRELTGSARYHATDLAQDNYFEHDSYDLISGNLTKVCNWYERISVYYQHWTNIGENIAAGQPSPESVVEGWMASAGHRANILSPDFWEIGVGYYEGGGSYYRYWVQDFGRREDIYPLLINSDQAQTISREVEIFIYGAWTEMRLRNEDGEWTEWQAFRSSFPWTLSNQVGERLVTAELRSSSKTATSSDTIYLNADKTVILSGIPEKISYYYSRTDDKFYPESFFVRPTDANAENIFSWEISSQSDWWKIEPQNGTFPASFSLSPGDSLIDGAPTSFSVTVNVVGYPYEVVGAPVTIDVSLIEVEGPIRQVRLPVVIH